MNIILELTWSADHVAWLIVRKEVTTDEHWYPKNLCLIHNTQLRIRKHKEYAVKQE